MQSHIVRILENSADVDCDAIIFDREFAFHIKVNRRVTEINSDGERKPHQIHQPPPRSQNIDHHDEDQDGFDERFVKLIPRRCRVFGNRNRHDGNQHQNENRLHFGRKNRQTSFGRKLRRDKNRQRRGGKIKRRRFEKSESGNDFIRTKKHHNRKKIKPDKSQSMPAAFEPTVAAQKLAVFFGYFPLLFLFLLLGVR